MEQKTRAQAEEHYYQVRLEAREAIIGDLRQLAGPNVSLSDLNPEAIRQAESWRESYPDLTLVRPAWSWQKELRRFRMRPRRIEVALWYGDTLCGLALGRISDRCVVATIHFLEALPQANPLKGKVLLFIVRFLEAVAASLGCREVALDRPVPELVSLYDSLGFSRHTKKGMRVLRQSKQLAL